MESIHQQIRQERRDFTDNRITIVEGYDFNQYETIKRAHLYLNSQYEDHSLYQGREKIFYNICKHRRDAAARFLNLDTKDVRLWPTNAKSRISTLLLEKELHLWMKQHKIDQLMNDVAVEAPTYGTAVIKMTKKGAEMVDLRRLMNDPTVERIRDSRFVIQKHYFTPSELRKMKDRGWDKDKIEQIIRKKQFKQGRAAESYEDDQGNLNEVISTDYIEVYERYGEVPEKWLSEGGNTNTAVPALMIVAEPDMFNDNEHGTRFEDGVVLFESRWTRPWPYRDFHYSKTRGRWLGVGVIEDLFPIQERFNEMVNQRRAAMEISSIQLFQSTDSTVVNNVRTDLQTGDLITTQSDRIEPIATEDRNLQSHQVEFENYSQAADQISFASNLISGQQIESSTPATNAVIQNNNASSVFLFKRENLTEMYREFFNEEVLPRVKKDLKTSHILRFIGEPNELRELDREHAKVKVQDFVWDSIEEDGHVPTKQEVETFREGIKQKMRQQGSQRFADIKDNMYDNLSVEFDILVGNTQEDVSVIAQNTFTLLTALAQNPQLIQDPVFKTLTFEYAEKIGINPAKLELADSAREQEEQQQQSKLSIQQLLGQEREVTPSNVGQNT